MQTVNVKKPQRTIGFQTEILSQSKSSQVEAFTQTNGDLSTMGNSLDFGKPVKGIGLVNGSSFQSLGILSFEQQSLQKIQEGATGTLNAQGKYILPRKIRTATKSAQTESTEKALTEELVQTFVT